MAFIKALLGGICAVLLTWVVIIGVHMAMTRDGSRTGELRAVAGGWTHLLHLPLVLVILTVAFGIGLYLASR